MKLLDFTGLLPVLPVALPVASRKNKITKNLMKHLMKDRRPIFKVFTN